MLDLDVETFQFYMGNDACTIKYIKDEYTNDELGPKVHEVSIPKGETKTLKFSLPVDIKDVINIKLESKKVFKDDPSITYDTIELIFV